MTDLDYLKLNKPQKMLYDLKNFLRAFPARLGNGLKNLVMIIISFFKGI